MGNILFSDSIVHYYSHTRFMLWHLGRCHRRPCWKCTAQLAASSDLQKHLNLSLTNVIPTTLGMVYAFR